MSPLRAIYQFLHPKYQTVHLDYKVDFRPRYGHGRPPHPRLYDIIDANRAQYEQLLGASLSHTAIFHQIKAQEDETDPDQPGWNNGFLSGLDIIGMYTVLSHFAPSRYVEVGSGNSTKVAAKVKREQLPKLEMTSIDPYPRVEIDRLVDEVIREPFEDGDLGRVLSLDENDVLFIDNSHRVLPNSDSTVFFLEVLPELRPGVIVHIHDIFLPYDYPQVMCDWAFSEQYALAAFLLANPERFEVLLPNAFISEDPALRSIIADVWDNPVMHGVNRTGGSFWMRVT